jgi:hypothetical protein
MHYKRKLMYSVCEPVLPPKNTICEATLKPTASLTSLVDVCYNITTI